MYQLVTANEALNLADNGKARIIDVRGPREFGLGHPPGSISLPYSARGLASRLGILISNEKPLIILANEQDQLQGAAEQLASSPFQLAAAIDIDNVSSKLGEILSAKVDELSVSNLIGGEYTILDVREQIEWEMGYIPQSILISLGDLNDRIDELKTHSKIAVICEAGIRSSSAVSVLLANGFTNVFDVPGGTAECRAENVSLEYYES